MKKDTTSIVERNGGMHDQKAYRRIKTMLDAHGFTSPRLYHLVLLDHIEGPLNASRFLGAIKAICRKLREYGIEYRWRGALELDAKRGGKGLHFHLFLLVEAANVNPTCIIRRTGWLREMLGRRAMTFHLAPPKADMHRVGGTIEGKRQDYATLAGEKLGDCLEWLSYLVKSRDKPTHIRGIYFSSRDSKHEPAPANI